MDINELILKEAEADLNKKEKKGNQGWEDPAFELEMKMTGWELGQAWCAYWAEKVWTNAYSEYNSLMVNVLRKLFSANAVATWNNFEQSGGFPTLDEPVPGAVIIWMKKKNGKPDYVGDTQWIRGHAGIVRAVNTGDTFDTFEGNSNDEGGREGIEVAGLTRKLDFDVENGLQLLGFVHPVL